MSDDRKKQIESRLSALERELKTLKERLKHLESIGLIPKEKKPDKIEE